MEAKVGDLLINSKDKYWKICAKGNFVSSVSFMILNMPLIMPENLHPYVRYDTVWLSLVGMWESEVIFRRALNIGNDPRGIKYRIVE